MEAWNLVDSETECLLFLDSFVSKAKTIQRNVYHLSPFKGKKILFNLILIIWLKWVNDDNISNNNGEQQQKF